MKFALLVLCWIAASVLTLISQILPTPVINDEIKDNGSIRMRSIELERLKRNLRNPRPPETSKETEIRYAEIKDDFESIQKIQSSIVKTYTTGLEINYERIRKLAFEMRKKAIRLDINFFNTDPLLDSSVEAKNKKTRKKTTRDLIIELDKAIGRFVSSPIFKQGKIVSSDVMEKSQNDLYEIVKLCDSLSQVTEN